MSHSYKSASSDKCLKLEIGDYIRWPIHTTVFAVDDAGNADPLEVVYAYGIVIEVAIGTDIASDAAIIRSTSLQEWIVAHVDDPDYKFEVLSRGLETTENG